MSVTPVDRRREERWAAAARDGDRAAVEALLEALYDQVRAVCRRICANDADGDDATQEALISIVRALPSFDGRSAVRTWAYRIATNAALDELRRRGRRAIPSDDDGASAAARDDAPLLDARIADRLALEQALGELAPDFRSAVVLRDVVGMDYADIAAALDVPIGTVRSRIARGRRQLANLMGIGNQPAPADVIPDDL